MYSKNLKFDLDDGHQVRLESLNYGFTYSAILAGYPTEDMNERILKRALSKMDKLWGLRATYIVPPTRNRVVGGAYGYGGRPPRVDLPRIEICTWLQSKTTFEKWSMGSELVVIWYRDNWQNESLYEVVYEGIRKVPWPDHAEDYEI